MKKRKEGFYWVKLNGTWTIMSWEDDCGECLWYSGCQPFVDKNLDEIDENRIEREV